MLKQTMILIRVRQWLKNFFVFLPIMFTPDFWDIENISTVVIAFVALCFASSLTYIINDYNDIKSDQTHPIKRNRPLASGRLSKKAAKIIFSLVFFTLLAIIAINHKYMFIMLYLINTTIYTFFLKKILIWDIFSIALGFLIRTYFGAFVIQINLTSWFLMSTLAISIFLASSKRYQEIRFIGVAARTSLKLYSEQLILYMMFVSATCAIVFYSLAAATKGNLLILSSAFVILGIFRYTHVIMNTKEESPSEIVLRDNQLHIIVLLWSVLTIIGFLI